MQRHRETMSWVAERKNIEKATEVQGPETSRSETAEARHDTEWRGVAPRWRRWERTGFA